MYQLTTLGPTNLLGALPPRVRVLDIYGSCSMLKGNYFCPW
jgi:hypothetical protein